MEAEGWNYEERAPHFCQMRARMGKERGPCGEGKNFHAEKEIFSCRLRRCRAHGGTGPGRVGGGVMAKLEFV